MIHDKYTPSAGIKQILEKEYIELNELSNIVGYRESILQNIIDCKKLMTKQIYFRLASYYPYMIDKIEI